MNKALEGKDVEEIKKATESLTQVFYSISEKLYSQKAENGANAKKLLKMLIKEQTEMLKQQLKKKTKIICRSFN